MTTQVESTISVTLNLPNGVYKSFKCKAAQTHRSVEDELLVAVVQKSGKSDVLADEIPLERVK